ncbi:hypothetical protein RKD41_006252 [Streptomyces tendae]
MRPWTRRPVFFSAFSRPAAIPRERSTASESVVRSASYRRVTSSGVSEAASLNGDIFAACRISSL